MSQRLTVRVSDRLAHRLDAACQRTGLSKSEAIRAALSAWADAGGPRG